MFAKQEGLCHWCNGPMVLLHGVCTYPPKNLATIDHLDSRLSPERGKHSGKLRKVAACWECNNKRAAAEERSLGLPELRRRSCNGGAYDVG